MAPTKQALGVCKHCGTGHPSYLQAKGANVGQYCQNCGGWIKWVPKGALPALKGKGFRVYSEGQDVPLQTSFVEEVQTPATPQTQQVSQDYPYFAEEEHVQAPGGVVQETQDMCPVCTSGRLTPMEESAVDLRIFEHVLYAATKDNSATYVRSRINYCPECGRKL